MRSQITSSSVMPSCSTRPGMNSARFSCAMILTSRRIIRLLRQRGDDQASGAGLSGDRLDPPLGAKLTDGLDNAGVVLRIVVEDDEPVVGQCGSPRVKVIPHRVEVVVGVDEQQSHAWHVAVVDGRDVVGGGV